MPKKLLNKKILLWLSLFAVAGYWIPHTHYVQHIYSKHTNDILNQAVNNAAHPEANTAEQKNGIIILKHESTRKKAPKST